MLKEHRRFLMFIIRLVFVFGLVASIYWGHKPDQFRLIYSIAIMAGAIGCGALFFPVKIARLSVIYPDGPSTKRPLRKKRAWKKVS